MKKIVLLVGASAALWNVLGYASETGEWIVDAKGCKVWNSHPQPDESVEWSGKCKDGYAEGPGVLQWFRAGVPGGRLEGNLLIGKPVGKGSHVTSNGTRIDGEYVDGELSGRGVMTWPNGDRYEGDWLRGKRTGKGTLARSNGDRYEGDFMDGKWSGKGVFTGHSGERYEGDWVDNKRQGKGSEVRADGTRYEGEFEDDAPAYKCTRVPVTMAGLQPLVVVKINGADATFLLDSGALYSMITREAASQYRLQLHHAPGGFRGIGGTIDTDATYVERFELSGRSFSHLEFLVGGRSTGAAGILGQNILAPGDVDYDLANGMVHVLDPLDCGGISLASFGKSGEEVSVIEIEAPTKAHTLSSVATARLNGKRIRVLFDTGSPTSLLSERAAQNAGFKRTAPGVVDAGLTGGLGRRAYQSWIASFDTFEIGRERIHHARLRVADMDDVDVDMLLGADFFLSHHLYVSNVLHRVWFAYTGGPIFDLQRAAQYAAADSGGEKASRNKQGEPADAPGLARRGAAYEARGDLAHAIEDLTRAIQMDPAQTLYLEERAVAYAKQHQSAPALADLDQALKLKPDELGALVFRAELRAQAQDLQGALADVDAADRLIPREAGVRLRMGAIYMQAEAPAQALGQFDRWIETHPDDPDVPNAKGARCWARALLGTDLDSALKDCDAAIRKGEKSASFLDARGLVLLRLGKYNRSIDDYDAALDLDPRRAWALYGRGIDRLRKGWNSEGQADIASATAILPSIAEQARRHGIAP